jgi:hypothetical protein
MEIGEIKKMCFNKYNILIPSGYLECDGQEITEDMFPELHFHLSEGVIEGPIKLPKVKREKNGTEYIFITLIAYTDKNVNDTKYNAEFIIKTKAQNNINVKKVHAFKRHVWRK